jgi:hypothetical protein
MDGLETVVALRYRREPLLPDSASAFRIYVSTYRSDEYVEKSDERVYSITAILPFSSPPHPTLFVKPPTVFTISEINQRNWEREGGQKRIDVRSI